MCRQTVLISVSAFALITGIATASAETMAGREYLDQPPPGNEAALFAPGIVSDGLNNRDVAMTPDGSEFYFAVNMRGFELSTILGIYYRDGQWSSPEVAPFATDKDFKFLEPSISPDGSKFFFVASARDGENNNEIWVMQRDESGWGKPQKLGENINTPVSETFPSVTTDGTLYFSRTSEDPRIEHIYRSKLVDGAYSKAERLPENVNSGQTQFNPFIAADESYLIVPVYGREDSIGSIDYYIVYRNEQDQWSEPVNMGPRINTPGAQEYSAFVSRDGKYLFFMSTRLPVDGDDNKTPYEYGELNRIHNTPENGNSDIYWIDAGIIDELRPDGF